MTFTKLTFGLATFALAVASAASNHSRFTVFEPVWVGSTELKTGEYTVEMQGDKAVFKNSGKMVAEVPATLDKNDQKFETTAIQLVGKKLQEIDLGGSTAKIVLAPVSTN